jgi:peptide/nickel transport system permease protein
LLTLVLRLSKKGKIMIETTIKPSVIGNHNHLVLRQIWQSMPARIGGLVLVLFYLLAAFADFFSPYSMHFADPDLANAPPTKIHLIINSGLIGGPFVYPVERNFDPETYKQTYSERIQSPVRLEFFVDGESYKIFGLIPCKLHLFGVRAPARIFLLGSDINGRDNFSRLFFGAQKSLTIGFLGLLIMFPVGIIYGGIAGVCGGIVDNIMMRIAEAIMSVPGFYLLIALAAILPASMTSSQRFALITVILSFIGWAGLARVIRGMVLAIRELEFVEAGKAIGLSEWKNMVTHVLPQTASFVIVAATLQVPNFILSESGLSFIGLGIQQPDASWGNMLKAALDNANDLYNQPWLLSPGILIFVTILCFNTLGDTLRDIVDPKSFGL